MIRVGHTLDAFLPEKPTVNNTPSGIEIEGVEYLAVADLTEEQKEGKTAQDVILVGEVTVDQAPILPSYLYSRVKQGHSSWGQFRILGRVRPYDGLVSFIKDYVRPSRVPTV